MHGASALGPLLTGLGPRTDDPATLLARAEGLQASGLPLTIETRRLAPALVARVQSALSDLHGPTIVPVEQGGRVVGLRIGVEGGVLGPLGLRPDDVLASVNGAPVSDQSRAFGPLPFGAPHLLLLEVVRGGENRLLVYRW